MVFSSIIFLFLFLPIVLALYHLLLLPVSLGHRQATVFRRLANLFLLIVSLIFYFWGEQWLIWLVMASTFVDYFCGLFISGAFHKGRIEMLSEDSRRTSLQRFGLILSLTTNLLFLGFFKYFNFGIDSFNNLFPESLRLSDVIRITLPLGISFYTFQSMSYTIDVYRGHVKATRNLIDFACYVTLFPQLVAGPIVRYRDVAYQLVHRTMNKQLFTSGVNRFILGLGKKVLIANTLARSSDNIFALSPDQLTTPQAWMATVCYTLQIYFDFSGYSDMAIGLGRMFGFEFLENFNYPYISRSIHELWRRWHISLSTWFRDYLYIPLGGSKKGSGRTYFNLITVFFLCGLWHGAKWSYVAWGLFHGLFLVLERLGLGRIINRLPRVLQHIYTLLIIMAGYTLFATESFSHSMMLLKSMAGFAPAQSSALMLEDWWSIDILVALIFGTIFSAPIYTKVSPILCGWSRRNIFYANGLELLRAATFSLILLFCAMSLASGTHNPFIYFRF
ncbi:MAG: MBOAT family protein [Kiritimatiellae bacterium]|jgi:alginate O-acetyltransferase complex protein AlgI|nr:MBOAT family protein [Kiritimatiellia bacterium]